MCAGSPAEVGLHTSGGTAAGGGRCRAHLRVGVLGLGTGGNEPLTVAALQQDDAGRTAAGLGLIVEQHVLWVDRGTCASESLNENPPLAAENP